MPIKKVALPEEALVAETSVPDVTTTYPNIEGPYTIPDWARPLIDGVYRQRVIQSPKVRLYRLTDVYAVDEALLFNEQGQVYEVTTAQYPEERIVSAHRLVQNAVYEGTLTACEHPLVHVKRLSPFVFGHWMVDMLPIAYSALRMLHPSVAQTVGFFVHRTNGPMDQTQQQSLARLWIPPERLLWGNSGPLFCKEIYVASGLSEHGRFISPMVSECHQRVAAEVAGSGTKRIFVLRGSRTRGLVNEPELALIAASRGYRLFDPGDAPFDLQIAAFKDARVIVGAMGSAMTNILYAQTGAQVVLLSPESMPDTFFWLIAQLRSLQYLDVRCEQVGPAATPPQPMWARAMSMDADRFRALLDRIA